MSILNRIHNLIAAMPYGLEKMLSMMDIEESTDVKTACVPIGGRPKIVLNPEYVKAHCETDEKLYMLIQHELHHVLLGHTRLFKRSTPQHNIAFDAIINAMLCRAKPEPEWTALFRDSYAHDKFPECLLRPPQNFPNKPIFPEDMPDNVCAVIESIYYSQSGTFFDVFALLVKVVQVTIPKDMDGQAIAQMLGNRGFGLSPDSDLVADLLGNHDDDARGLESQDDPDLFDIVRQIVEDWPQPPNPIAGRSLSDVLKDRIVERVDVSRLVVRQMTDAVLSAVVSRGKEKGGIWDVKYERYQQFLPSRDRRAFAMQQVGGLVPMYVAEIPKEISTRNEVAVYVDVSGSMQEYPNYLIRALQAVQRRVKVRTFVFSTVVEEVLLENVDRPSYSTTHGTSGLIVWRHIRENEFKSVVVLTDGYVGKVEPQFRDMKKTVNIQFLITPEGWKDDVQSIATRCQILKNLSR